MVKDIGKFTTLFYSGNNVDNFELYRKIGQIEQWFCYEQQQDEEDYAGLVEQDAIEDGA